MKKLISILMVLTLIFSVTGNCFATHGTTQKINEYELYKEMISKSDAEFKKIGMSNKDIKELRNFSFDKVFKERAQLDRQTLLKMGYNDNQINSLKSVRSTEKDRMTQLMRRGLFADLDNKGIKRIR